jgi:selenocysteine lyase/cysteine desulfurase
MQKRGMRTVEQRIIELRDRAYTGLTKISKIQVVSPPPGPLAAALVAFKLPDTIKANAFRQVLLNKYRIVIKVTGKWFNGNRISPHIFNSETQIDAAITAIRNELA